MGIYYLIGYQFFCIIIKEQIQTFFVMEIVEQQSFGNACLCGDVICLGLFVFMCGEDLQGCVDDSLLFFFGQMKKLFIHGRFLLTGLV